MQNHPVHQAVKTGACVCDLDINVISFHRYDSQNLFFFLC